MLECLNPMSLSEGWGFFHHANERERKARVVV